MPAKAWNADPDRILSAADDPVRSATNSQTFTHRNRKFVKFVLHFHRLPLLVPLLAPLATKRQVLQVSAPRNGRGDTQVRVAEGKRPFLPDLMPRKGRQMPYVRFAAKAYLNRKKKFSSIKDSSQNS